MLPGTIDGMKHVCYFRHALALDERRVKFLPEYAYGGTATPPTKPDDKQLSLLDQQSTYNDSTQSTGSMDDLSIFKEPLDDRHPADNEAVVDPSQAGIKSTAKPPHTIEVWFAGTHSDM